MPHFFINSKSVENNKIILSDKDNYNHIVKSLRIKVGEKIVRGCNKKWIQYLEILGGICLWNNEYIFASM